MKAFRVILCLTLLLLGVTPGATAHTQLQSISCQRASSLPRSPTITGSACFRLTPRQGSTALRIDLVVSRGAYDLYVRQGNAPALSGADKVNVGAISGSLTYVYPGTGPFTVAVARTSSSGSAQLLQRDYQPSIKCNNSTCSAAYPLTSMPGQAVFEIPRSKAGRIDVKAAWSGSARLSALLYGPAVSKTGVTQSTLARKDGSSPLALRYDVRSTNLIAGGKWSAGLSNASKAGGAVPNGTLTITYPR